MSLSFKTIIILNLIILNDFCPIIIGNVGSLILNTISIDNLTIFHIIIRYHLIAI